MTAFEGCVDWTSPDGRRIEIELDPLMAARDHVSRHTGARVEVAVLGRVGGKHASPSQSDAEFVAAAFEENGMDFANVLVGEFAAVVFDRETQVLHLARDVAGTRPLYFAVGVNRVWFATSVAAVCDNAGLPGSVNEHALAAMLCGRAPSLGQTLMNDVLIVPPAHRVSFEGGTGLGARPAQTSTEYWQPLTNVQKQAIDRVQAATQMAELLKQVTSDLLRSADVVGLHLTGGVDSALVASALAFTDKARDTAPLGFAWQSDPDTTSSPQDDQLRVKSIADSLALSVNYCPATVDSLKTAIALDPMRQPTEMVALEDPVLAQSRSSDVTVLFSGWGGDEVASATGKHHLARLFRTGRWVRLGRDASRSDGSTARLVVSAARLGLRRRPTEPTPVNRGYATSELHQLQPADPPDNEHFRSTESRQLARLRKGHVGHRCAAWSVAAAQSGIQHVYPLLDRRVIEFALSLSSDLFAVPCPRSIAYDALGELAPPDMMRPIKDEPSRAPTTLQVVSDLLVEFGQELPLRSDMARHLDLTKLASAIARLPQESMLTMQPGRLLAALQVGFDRDGVPLSELLKR